MNVVARPALSHARALIFRAGAFLVLAALLIIASFISPTFATATNLLNILRQMAITGVISIGMTMVILTGGIDLSVGSVVALISVLVAGFQDHGTLFVVILGVIVGPLIGLANGTGVVLGHLQPFIITLAMMTVTRGLAFMYSQGKPLEIQLDGLDAIGSGAVLSIPIPGLVFGAFLLASAWMLAATPFGRHLYAIGSNEEATRLSGVRVNLHLVAVYTLCGLLAGIAGLLFVAQQGVGTALAGTGYELNAIAAVVLGGTSLFGGEGTVWGTSAGAAIIAILGNIMNLTGINPFTQDFMKGVIIVAAVLLQRRFSD